jgi:hypothetical protein
MKRVLLLAAVVLVAAVLPAHGQQNDIAALKAEVARQQVAIQQLLQRIDALEKRQAGPPAAGATTEAIEDELKGQQDSINSIRDAMASKVNINGYYNFRFFTDETDEPVAFQQHHLGLLAGKQLGRFNFLMELELQNVPHHPEITGETDAHAAEPTVMESDISGEGQVSVENAWMEYNHNEYFGIRLGKQLSPQYWWQNHYPNLTYSTTLPIYLRELFPSELVGAMVQGSVLSRDSEMGLNYKFYVANNNFEGNSRADLRDGKAYGGRAQFKFLTGNLVKKADVAVDFYKGQVGLVSNELVEDHVTGWESQLEISRFLFQHEYARGTSQGLKRTGYYVQPAARISDDWLAFYRVEQLVSPRIFKAERRYLIGVNYRPMPQIVFKGEWYRSMRLDRPFLESSADEHKPFNGIATSAVFFF